MYIRDEIARRKLELLREDVREGTDYTIYFPPLSRQKFGIFKVEDFFPPCVVSVMFFYPKNTC